MRGMCTTEAPTGHWVTFPQTSDINNDRLQPVVNLGAARQDESTTQPAQATPATGTKTNTNVIVTTIDTDADNVTSNETIGHNSRTPTSEPTPASTTLQPCVIQLVSIIYPIIDNECIINDNSSRNRHKPQPNGNSDSDDNTRSRRRQGLWSGLVLDRQPEQRQKSPSHPAQYEANIPRKRITIFCPAVITETIVSRNKFSRRRSLNGVGCEFTGRWESSRRSWTDTWSCSCKGKDEQSPTEAVTRPGLCVFLTPVCYRHFSFIPSLYLPPFANLFHFCSVLKPSWEGTCCVVIVIYAGSAAGMESLEKVWNLFLQFPDLEKVWKFVKSFGNFKKRFGILPSTSKKFWSVPPARALGSCCRAFDRKQFEGCTVFSHLFLFIVQTA